MTHPGLDHQPATRTHCPHCLQNVIHATTDGIPITTNPTPLDLADQIRAHLDHRATYELHIRASGHLDLIPRTASRIHHHPDATVLADHRCTQPRVHWRQAAKLPPPVLLTVRAGLPDAGDTPPF